jgi:glycosyltransferase involved in cell wall biosynthesis
VDQWKRRIPFVREKFLETQLARFQPDVLFLLQGGAYDCFQEYHLLRWCRVNGVPYILNCSLNRRGANFGPQTIDSFARDFADASQVLFMSTENLRLTEELFREQLPNAQVIQNPLDLEIAPAEVGGARPGPRARLGFVGRIDIHHKGLDLLLEAMTRVRGDFDLELHLTGRSEKPEDLAALVERHGLSDRVLVHDHADREGLVRAYAKAELMVLPSRWEGCASVMLEAMMAGRPQLVTPVGGVSDWLTDGVDAYIADGVSVDAIESALRRAFRQRERWPEIGQAARSAFEAKRDPDPVRTLVGIVDGARR